MEYKKPENTNSVADEQKTVTMINKTKVTLHIKNKRKSSFGPQKGKWVVYKEFKLAPRATDTTSCFKTDEHQLSVHSATENESESFFYTIHDYDISDGNTIEMIKSTYKIIE